MKENNNKYEISDEEKVENSNEEATAKEKKNCNEANFGNMRLNLVMILWVQN